MLGKGTVIHMSRPSNEDRLHTAKELFGLSKSKSEDSKEWKKIHHLTDSLGVEFWDYDEHKFFKHILALMEKRKSELDQESYELWDEAINIKQQVLGLSKEDVKSLEDLKEQKE